MKLKEFNSKYKQEIDLFALTNELGGKLVDDIKLAVSSVPFLEKLFNEKLLFFSTKYVSASAKVGSRLKDLKKKKEISEDSDYLSIADISDVVKESLEGIRGRFFELNDNAKYFLELLVDHLVNIDKNTAPSTFEGLSLEVMPFLDSRDGSRADHYYYDQQKIRVCTRKFPIPLSSNIMTVLAHEFTHAVDDICFSVGSVKSFLKYLINKTDESSIRPVIITTANILNKELTTLYLPQFFEDLAKEQLKTMSTFAVIKQWYMDDDGNSISLQNDSGCLYYSTVPAEFITFYVEAVFEALIQTKDIRNFVDNLAEQFQQNINSNVEDNTQ